MVCLYFQMVTVHNHLEVEYNIFFRMVGLSCLTFLGRGLRSGLVSVTNQLPLEIHDVMYVKT